MNIFKFTLITVATISFTGCSLVNSLTKPTQNTNGTAATETTESTPPIMTAPTIATEPEEPTDSIAPTAPSRSTEQSALVSELAGEWTIFQVGATTIDRDENMPYIFFEPSTGNFYANNGCNTINGQFTISEKDELLFSNTLITMQYCPDVKFDNDINAIINGGMALPIAVNHVGAETFLDIKNEKGKNIMRLRRGDLGFLNGRWNVESVTGVDKIQSPADIFLDINELKVHGNTGCNYFNGTIYLDHRRSNAIDFSNIGSTRMACPFTNQETAIFVALEQTASVISSGNDKIMLLDSNGHQLMTLTRIPLEAIE